MVYLEGMSLYWVLLEMLEPVQMHLYKIPEMKTPEFSEEEAS
jgi:hypothetical protein